jgi:hypothetical protein
VERVGLNSSAIEAFTYDENRRALVVEFRDGDSYRYFDVPETVYHELLEADSAGAFWNQVKDNYTFAKLD